MPSSTPTPQIKSRERVADHGEVFTPEWLVEDMLDLVRHETERIDSRFLEPACGDGNFLAPVLKRKLAVVRRQYRRNPADYERYAVIALMSIYGVELLADNAISCRERLLKLWLAEYTDAMGRAPSDDCLTTCHFVLERNIVNGNALSMKKVDAEGQDLDEPIIFSEWAAVMGNMFKRRDFRFDEILNKKQPREDIVLSDDELGLDFKPRTPIQQFRSPQTVREFPLTDYRKLHLAEA